MEAVFGVLFLVVLFGAPFALIVVGVKLLTKPDSGRPEPSPSYGGSGYSYGGIVREQHCTERGEVAHFAARQSGVTIRNRGVSGGPFLWAVDYEIEGTPEQVRRFHELRARY